MLTLFSPLLFLSLLTTSKFSSLSPLSLAPPHPYLTFSPHPLSLSLLSSLSQQRARLSKWQVTVGGGGGSGRRASGSATPALGGDGDARIHRP